MSTGHSDHAYDPHKSPDSTPQSAPMNKTASPGSSPIGGATIELNNTAAMSKPQSGDKKFKSAKTVVAPLDRVKILFQASNPQFAKYTGSWTGLAAAIRDIKRTEGVKGLYKGHSVTLLRIFPYAAIKFLAYEQIRAVIIPSSEYETPFRRLVSGSLAGVTSVCFTYPLELMRVRMAFETRQSHRSGLVDIWRQIYHERVQPPSTTRSAAAAQSSSVAVAETASSAVSKVVPRTGIANFYRGFSPTILGMLPYAGMSFLTHDTVGDLFRHPSVAPYTLRKATESENPAHRTKKPQLNTTSELLSGAMAGLVSQTSSYPVEVIRRRMQVGGAVGDGRRLGIAETARKIWLEKGFRGFWVGLTIGYAKVVPMVAVSFYVYERAKVSLGIH
ncbi:Mitochondrial carrier protein [Penicillium concentricum]|uniref:Mitochondrial thiamine pyrophosphate carrier 1 n=1 Tax=Penicillium concentricum TaxID=293559 RepID=A0A9W9RAX4_9EURO|nr:Mitochondrial carrier protein [Penicillium concentricum]KAJ5356821.1 Mitochondrial carrier protein [Penicillium concentricum]